MTIQTGSRGTQACINAAGTIDGVIADLETTVMFAEAGTLNPEPGETFANHRLDNKLVYCSYWTTCCSVRLYNNNNNTRLVALCPGLPR